MRRQRPPSDSGPLHAAACLPVTITTITTTTTTTTATHLLRTHTV
jgi:hypothetical protein